MLKLTDSAKQAALATHVRPNLIFQIEGYNVAFAAVQPSEFIRIGDPGLVIGDVDDPWVVGGVRDASTEIVKAYISFTLGGSTTSKITQQLSPDRAQGSSITSMTISILDKSEEISRLISPGLELEDVLGANATVYLGFEGTAYPQDYIPLFKGLIQSAESAPGMIHFGLANTEEKKRTGTFVPRTWPLAELIPIDKQIEYDIDLGTLPYTPFIKSNDHELFVGDIVRFGDVGTLNEVNPGQRYRVNTIPDADTFTIKYDTDFPGGGVIFSHEADDQIMFVAYNITEIMLTNPSLFASPVLGPDGLVDPSIEFYVKIDDEIFKYTGKSADSLTGVTRAQFGTLPEEHDEEADVQSFYRLQGNGMDLALKIYLSGWNGPFVEDVPVENFVDVTPFVNQVDSLLIKDIDVEKEYGLTIGDYATITDASEPDNNITALQISDIQIVDDGSVLVFSGSGLMSEVGSTAKIAFRSQYDTLGQGLKLKPSEVDVAEHQRLKNLFLSGFFFDFAIDEIPNTKDFVEKQIYFPMSCFSVPRKAKASVAIHVGPIGGDVIPILDASNVCNAEKIRLARSTANYFINTIKYAYDLDAATGKYKTTKVYESLESKIRIPIGDKLLAINSDGMRSTLDAELQSNAAADRFLGRYQFGAEYIKGIEVLYGQGFTLEIGDIVGVDFGSLKITDVKTGTRAGGIKLFEVINKSDDHKTGKVTADVQSTSFGVDDRFATFSPSTYIGPGATESRLPLVRSFGTKSYQRESLKWVDYIGEKIEITSPDWTTFREVVTIGGLDQTVDPPAMLVTPPLPSAPLEGYLIQSPSYPDSEDGADMKNWKTRHAYLSPNVDVVDSADELHFEVDPADIDKFLAGATVQIYNDDFTDLSPEIIIASVDPLTNIIELRDEAGFTIDNSHKVRFIGFKDGGASYRWV